MIINEVIVWILMICMLFGAVDRAFLGNRLGLGEKFEEGFMALGPLALAMVGVICWAPVLAKLLSPIVGPIYDFLGADPAMFAGTLLANDMGGYSLAQDMTENAAAAQLSGLFLGAMMGATVVFTIPVSLGIIDASDRPYLAKGILAGIVTVPVGVLVGGLAAGFPLSMVVANLIPIVLTAALIAFGLWRAPDKMTKGFEVFGKVLVSAITIGLAIAVFQFMTGVNILPAGWELASPEEGLAVVGSIGMMLLGAFPAVALIIKYAAKPLTSVGGLIAINETAAGGLVASLANVIPMFEIMKHMDARGKILNAAFAVGAGFAFGDHLGFTAGVARDMIFPVILAKLVAGITAVLLALLLFGKSFPGHTQDASSPAQASEV